MKIAILTHYYKSINYGGMLQAYALCRFLNDNGYQAEQLQYIHNFGENNDCQKDKNVIKVLRKMPSYIYRKINHKRESDYLLKRRETFRKFSERYVPHSKEIFTHDNIDFSDEQYDCFIVGSDQVWNFKWYDKNYFLPFANKTKISYAASFSMNNLNDMQKEIVKKELKNFTKISVREEKGIELLNDIGINNAKLTVDPTLLLSKEKWMKLIPEKIISDRYIFAYFLGNNDDAKKLMKKFSKKMGLKIVSISIASGNLKIKDQRDSDLILDNIDPFDFVSLIKNAEYIFTDSFHATLFSGIFSKQFIVFKREKYDRMSSRIVNILELYEQSERFCIDEKKMGINEIIEILSTEYNPFTDKLNNIINASKEFLNL